MGEKGEGGLAFRNMPITDFDSADLQHKLPGCVSALDGMIKAGHSVYVHCTAGRQSLAHGGGQLSPPVSGLAVGAGDGPCNRDSQLLP